VAQAMVQMAQFEHRRGGPPSKVPRWLLRFALRSPSQDPPSPASVVADSLSIITLDLECDVSSVCGTFQPEVSLHSPSGRHSDLKPVHEWKGFQA
jgi:hypothetical protein